MWSQVSKASAKQTQDSVYSHDHLALPVCVSYSQDNQSYASVNSVSDMSSQA